VTFLIFEQDSRSVNLQETIISASFFQQAREIHVISSPVEQKAWIVVLTIIGKHLPVICIIISVEHPLPAFFIRLESKCCKIDQSIHIELSDCEECELHFYTKVRLLLYIITKQLLHVLFPSFLYIFNKIYARLV